ncbi:TPA: VirB8/TrbF family protein [Legionella pneumophila]
MNFIKKGVLKTAKACDEAMHLPVENPYLAARRTWNGHVAGLVSSIAMWQLVGLSSLMISLASVGGMIYIGSQSKFIPLVFQQDGTGNTISMTRADALPPAKVDDYRTVASQFIENIRLVTADADLQRKAVLQTYAFLNATDPAAQKANEFLNASKEVNPFSRAAHETVSIDIRSVLQQSAESWQVDWIETVRSRDGSLKDKPVSMRAIVTLYQNEPTHDTTAIEALRNPHFIFVRDFNWSKLIQPGVM